jgi:ribose-phosphate pyrophosphokinase
MNNFKVFAGSSSGSLVKGICSYIREQGISGAEGNIILKRFADGESICQYSENIRGQDVFLVQSTNTDGYWIELLLMIDAARRASANKVTVVMPYMGYTRQDRKSEPRTPISVRLMLSLLERAGADRVITFDLHNLNIQGMADIPLDSLFGATQFFKDVKEDWSEWVIVSPDLGGIKSATAYSEFLGADFAFVNKKRKGNNVVHTALVGDVKGRKCLMIDDMTVTGGTILGANKKLKEEGGAKEVVGFVIHAPTINLVRDKIGDSDIDGFYTTDTINNKKNDDDRIKTIGVAPLLGEAIVRTDEDKSISSLFPLKGF